MKPLFVVLLVLTAHAQVFCADTFSFSGDSLTADLAQGRERTVLTGNARLVSNDLRISASTIELYGEEKGKQVQYAEAFEVCEYGRQPSPEEIRRLFPFLPEKK